MTGQPSKSDAAELLALAQEFVEGFNSGDVDRIMRFYADRYVDVNLEQPVQTKAERAEYYRKIIARGDTKVVDVRPEEIIVTGEYAIVRGTILLFRVAKDATKQEPMWRESIPMAGKLSGGSMRRFTRNRDEGGKSPWQKL